ncbi:MULTISPECIES: hypothetical protein [Cysteiniphilum]|uniref:Uncharacterized protein n=1 Tax=Cysteiniphilum litorale TaxID=2056700 RepID=A0A8J2Z551_9GAMM|nr:MULTISPECIES: hypothetical protein [Cysteiniphilum]GGF99331.1 hypothetical protein GCM10010995_15760 [Cysteiniphilum litorale]
MNKLDDNTFYQSQSIWSDDEGNTFKIVFGYFEDKETAYNFPATVRLIWEAGEFHFYEKETVKRSLVTRDDIRYENDMPLESIETLYNLKTAGQDDVFWRSNYTKRLDCIRREVVTKKIDQNIDVAYQELWRVIFVIMDNIAEAIKYGGELEIVGNSLDNALNLWKKSICLMQGIKTFSYQTHDDHLMSVHEILNEVFRSLNMDSSYRLIKLGQSKKYEALNDINIAAKGLLNGKYIFR